MKRNKVLVLWGVGTHGEKLSTEDCEGQIEKSPAKGFPVIMIMRDYCQHPWAENCHPRRRMDRVSPVLTQNRELSCEVVGIGLIAKEEGVQTFE